jgi:CheY-like chemotaxis protein
MGPVIAFVDDLMFLSRIREAARGTGVEVRSLRRVPELLEALQAPARLVLMDLDSPRLASHEALIALRADPRAAQVPVVGFFSHVHVERARVARAAGCARVLPRSAFVQELPSLLASPPAPASD